MRTPIRFRAETKYQESAEKKANTNLPIMATVGDHLAGTAAVAGRPGWYHIRLGGETVANPNPTVASRLTQCKAEGVGLVLNDLIFVVKARDRNLTYYKFHSFIQNTGGTSPHPILYARGIIIPDNVAQGFYIEDDDSFGGGTPEYLRIVTTDASQAVIFNHGEADVDFNVRASAGISDPTDAFFLEGSTGRVFMGDVTPTYTGHVNVYDATINTTASYYGLTNEHTKTLGATDANDSMIGFVNIMRVNQPGGTVGTLRGAWMEAELTDGSVGTLPASPRDMYGFHFYMDLRGGTVTRDAMAGYVDVDSQAANTVTDDLYGHRIDMDLAGDVGNDLYGMSVEIDTLLACAVGNDLFGHYIEVGLAGTVAGTVYMAFLQEDGNADYGIYQTSTGAAGQNYLQGSLGVGIVPGAAHNLYVYDNAVNTAATYYGGEFYHQKTAGVSDQNDDFYGLRTAFEVNQGGGVVGEVYGGYFFSELTAGTIGTAAVAKNLNGMYGRAELTGGTVYGSLRGGSFRAAVSGGALEDDAGVGDLYGNRVMAVFSAGTVDGDIYGQQIVILDSTGAGGTVYMLHLWEVDGVDYGIYQDGTARHYLQGTTAIGGTDSTAAQLYVDQSAAGTAIPVACFDQARKEHVLMKIIGIAEAASADRTLVADSDYGTPGALVGWIQIEIQDDGNRIADADYWVPFYATPT